MGPVRGFGAEDGSVPAEIARQPGGARALNIASAIKDRQAFSTQMNRTTLSDIDLPGIVEPTEDANGREVDNSATFLADLR
jgi:hypothetical protein